MNDDNDIAEQIIRQYRKSLFNVLDTELIDMMDLWVSIGVKVAQVILIFLGIIIIIPQLEQLQFLLELVIAIVGLFLTLIFEILYKITIARQSLEGRVFLLLYSLYSIYILVIFGLIYTSFAFFPDYSIILPIGVFLLIVILTANRYWDKISAFISDRISQIISDDMRKFSPVIERLMLELSKDARGIAYDVIVPTMGFLYIMISGSDVNVISLFLFFFIFIGQLFAFYRLLFPDRIIDIRKITWRVGRVYTKDLMTHCLELEQKLRSLDIVDYDTFYSPSSCSNSEESPEFYAGYQATRSVLYPLSKLDSILVITLNSININDIESLLSNRERRLKNGIYLPPFLYPVSKTLIDDRVLEQERVACISESPCFGMILNTKDLLRIGESVETF